MKNLFRTLIFCLSISTFSPAETTQPSVARNTTTKQERDEKQLSDQITHLYLRYLVNWSENLGDGWQKESSTAEKKAFQERTKENKNERERILKNGLTPEFDSKFKKMSQDTDSDPMLHAQDYMDDWFRVDITNIKLSENSATATVSFGDKDKHVLNITAKKILGLWRLDSVGSTKK